MERPQTTCTVVRVFPEVAYVGGWWVVFGAVGGVAVETLFIKISGAFIGVYVSLWCLCRMTGTKWNLRCRIRGNTAPNSGPWGLLAFCFHPGDENRLVLMLLFVFTYKVKSFVMLERREFILSLTRSVMSLLPKMKRFACEKQMASMSCLAPRESSWCFSCACAHIHSTSCAKLWLGVVHLAFYERTYFLFFKYSIFQATSERQTKAKERQDDRLSLFVSVPIAQNSTSSVC